MNRATAHLQGKQQSSFSKFNMEQGFKIAIWMLCLMCYLQAKPVINVSMADLGIGLLQPDVICGNETFTSPKNVTKSCHHAAVVHFIEQLELAQKKCNHTHWRINGTLQTLEEKVLKEVPEDTCELVTKTSQFGIFVNDIRDFVQNLNSNPNGSGK